MSETIGLPDRSSRTLPYQFQTQASSSWCGPSATRIALTALRAAGLVRAVPEQQELAVALGAADSCGVDLGIGTDEIDLIADVLNGYLGAARYRVERVVAPVSPAVSELLRRDLVHDIDSGYPLIANVVSGWRPWGYPSGRTVRHYVTVVGYVRGGEAAVVADPAFGLAAEGWRLPSATYGVAIDDLTAWITSKGYAA